MKAFGVAGGQRWRAEEHDRRLGEQMVVGAHARAVRGGRVGQQDVDGMHREIREQPVGLSFAADQPHRFGE